MPDSPHPRYHAVTHGSGLPLVMLHGVLGGAANWRYLMQLLPTGCQAHALTLPLFDEVLKLHTVQALVDYAAGYIESLGEPRVVLAGNSVGGQVALYLALRYPQRVAGLVLAGSSGLQERTFGHIPGLRPDRAWISERVREVFFDPVHASEEIIDYVHRVIHDRCCLKHLVRLFMTVRGDNMAWRLSRINCPALLLWGRDDTVTPPIAGEQFHALLPDSELHWFERCGHVPMLEHPELAARHLTSWWHRRIATDECVMPALEACAMP